MIPVSDTSGGSVLNWSAGPEYPVLAHREVHVWRVSLDQGLERVKELKTTLAQDELDRAARYKFDHHRSHFIVARGSLRTILGRYVRTHPSDIKFSYSSHGKPRILPTNVNETPSFNLSHSGGIALIALTLCDDIGVDVEYSKRSVRDRKIAERFFSNGEVKALEDVSGDLKKEAFFNCWTRKEAYIKAIGEGLSCSLDQFEVSLTPGEPAALLSVQGEPGASSRWWMVALRPEADYVAAVVVKGKYYNLVCWDLDQ